MSVPSWKKKLANAIAALSLTTSKPERRVALVGIGSELKGDDAAGVAVIRLLRPLFSGREDLLAIDAGPVPESFTAPLRRFTPDLVVLIDAGDFAGEPGEIRLIDWRRAEGFSASTHTLPLSVFAGYLETDLGCPVALLAIQPEQMEFGEEVTPAVRSAVKEIAAGLREIFA